jgi:AhpD family alkylhydroperoxidase
MEQRTYRKIYSAGELYRILLEGLRTAPRLRAAKKHRDLDGTSIERIMLAVTEVNGCEVCSYAHARVALERGLTSEEIRMLLAGDSGAIPPDEAVAIAFAQQYADARGSTSRASWQRLLEAYGTRKALGILAAARIMMIGNAYGIVWSAVLRRLSGRPVANSSLGYELLMLPVIVVFVPVALVHALVLGVLKRPIVKFVDAPS